MVFGLLYLSGIMEDVREECEKFGKVLSLEIPRGIQGIDIPGVGKVSSHQHLCRVAHIYSTTLPFVLKCIAYKFSIVMGLFLPAIL